METGAVVKWISDRKTVKKRNKTRSLKIAHQSFLSFSVGTEGGWGGGGRGGSRGGACFVLMPPKLHTNRAALAAPVGGASPYAVAGTDTSSRRLFLRLQEALLPFLGDPWMNFTQTLSCLNWTRNLRHRQRHEPHVRHRHPGPAGPRDLTVREVLLVRDVHVQLLPVGGRGPGAVEFGDDLDQALAAEQEVSFDGGGRALKTQGSNSHTGLSRKIQEILFHMYKTSN